MTRSIVEQAHDMYDAVPYEVPVPDESLFSLLDNAARLYPDRIALDYFGATTTYAQVREQVLKAAQVLHEAGVRSAGTLGGAGGFGVFTQGTHINHASHPMPGGIPCPISDQL